MNKMNSWKAEPTSRHASGVYDDLFEDDIARDIYDEIEPTEDHYDLPADDIEGTEVNVRIDLRPERTYQNNSGKNTYLELIHVADTEHEADTGAEVRNDVRSEHTQLNNSCNNTYLELVHVVDAEDETDAENDN